MTGFFFRICGSQDWRFGELGEEGKKDYLTGMDLLKVNNGNTKQFVESIQS